MPTDFVEDYEAVTGKKREDAFVVETKVIGAPETPAVEPVTVAEVE
jgi:hypothetical protein